MNNRLKLAVCFTLLLGLIGCGHPSEAKTTIGTHPLTIVDTSGKKPSGGTGKTHRDDAADTTTHFYDSTDGQYKITLVNDVLTINGAKYTMRNPKSEIRIVDDRIEFDGLRPYQPQNPDIAGRHS